MAVKFPMIHSTEYPAAEAKDREIYQFIANVEGGFVEGFYLKFDFEKNKRYADFESFMATVGGNNTDLKRFRAYRDLPKEQRMCVLQQNLIWKNQGKMYLVDMLDFPFERVWRMMTEFAPKHGLKFRRIQFEQAFRRVAVRVHFYNGKEMPF